LISFNDNEHRSAVDSSICLNLCSASLTLSSKQPSKILQIAQLTLDGRNCANVGQCSSSDAAVSLIVNLVQWRHSVTLSGCMICFVEEAIEKVPAVGLQPAPSCCRQKLPTKTGPNQAAISDHCCQCRGCDRTVRDSRCEAV
jgi:hypothetical protein